MKKKLCVNCVMHWMVRVVHCARTSSCTTAQAHVILQRQSTGSNIFPRIRFVMIYLTCKAFAFFISAFSFWCSPRRIWKAISFQTVEHHPVFDDVTPFLFNFGKLSVLSKTIYNKYYCAQQGEPLLSLSVRLHEILYLFIDAIRIPDPEFQFSKIKGFFFQKSISL